MKKILVAGLMLLLLLTSCATTVKVSYNQPSNVNMGAYRNIAIASCVEYSGTQSLPAYIRLDFSEVNPAYAWIHFITTSYRYSDLNRLAAEEATKMVTAAFTSNSYYDVLLPEKTDTYLSLNKIGKNPSSELKADGYDAVLVPKVTVLRTDEWVSKEKYYENNVEKYRYYINTFMEIHLTLTVVDTNTDKVIVTKTYRKTNSYREEFNPAVVMVFPNKLRTLSQDALSDMVGSVVSDFVPRKAAEYVSLMSNKPKSTDAKLGYEAAKNGNTPLALDVFYDVYDRTGHIPSGYNAATILAGTGDLDGAIALLERIRRTSADKKVTRLYDKLQELQRRNELAAQQMYSTEPSQIATGESSSIYDYLLN